jgi:hypothetical protein
MTYKIFEQQNLTVSNELKQELQSHESFGDLLNVGDSKLVGYLPLSTIKERGGKQAEIKITKWAKASGLSCKKIMGGGTDSGALYVWHNDQLAEFLKKHASVFASAQVPIKPEKYIDYIEHFTVSLNVFPNVYVLIAKTFNDPRFR